MVKLKGNGGIMTAQKTQEDLPTFGFVRGDTVKKILGGISEGALDGAVKAGIFPAPIKITARTVGWDVEAVRAFIENKKTEARKIQEAYRQGYDPDL